MGSLRTALYNYLFARHNGGSCILRIEDTDRTRLVEGAIEEQIASLAWAGVEFDEGPHVGGKYGPYTQSERFDLYTSHVELLIENGTAYYAFDSSEELDAMRQRQQNAGIAPKYDRSSMRNQYTLGEHETQRLLEQNAPRVVRLMVPLHEEIRFHDEVRGDMVVSGREIDDQILLKSDGFPTYHLANVVDDHLMEISHVIRAEEWLPSTPKHVLLYRAFGWDMPHFAHVPLMLDSQRKKLSKRYGAVMVQDFRATGYFPQALTNYVALCGWNPGTEQELFEINELIESFTLERVSKSGAIFDYQKLQWMNSQYLVKQDAQTLASELVPMLQEKGYQYITQDFVARAVTLLRHRVNFLAELVDFADYLFTDELTEVDKGAWDSLVADSALRTAVTAIRDGLTDHTLSSPDNFKALVANAAEAAGLKSGKVLKPLRLIITHREVGAELYDTIVLLGIDRVLERLAKFLR